MKHSDIGSLWERRFGKVDTEFFKSIDEIQRLPLDNKVKINEFPLVAGQVSIAKYSCLHWAFTKVLGLAGDFADVGTLRGASLLWIAKLMKIFQPHSASQIHAFDWWRDGEEDYTTLHQLARIQGLSDIISIHRMDLATELPHFGNDPIYGRTHFKYVFMDCGFDAALKQAIPFFWNRLVSGGVMVFDHFGLDNEHETELVIDLLPDGTKIYSFPFARQPSGYVIK